MYGVPLHRTSMTFEYFSMPLSSGSIRRMFCADCRFLWTFSMSRIAFQTSLRSVEANWYASSLDIDRLSLSNASAITFVGFAMNLALCSVQ